MTFHQENSNFTKWRKIKFADLPSYLHNPLCLCVSVFRYRCAGEIQLPNLGLTLHSQLLTSLPRLVNRNLPQRPPPPKWGSDVLIACTRISNSTLHLPLPPPRTREGYAEASPPTAQNKQRRKGLSPQNHWRGTGTCRLGSKPSAGIRCPRAS